MGLNNLAEAIILQSIEDLWDKKQQEEAMRFFEGKGFNICAQAAGMGFFEEIRLYNMINKIIKREMQVKKKSKKPLTMAAV